MDKNKGIRSLLNHEMTVKDDKGSNASNQPSHKVEKNNNTTTTTTVNKPNTTTNKSNNTNSNKTVKPTTNINNNKKNKKNQSSNSVKESISERDKARNSKLKNAYHVLPWSATLDVNTMADLTGLEKVYGLHNISSALQMLLNRGLKPLIEKTGAEGKHQFKTYRDVFLMDKKPKAIAHYKKFYIHEKQRRAND